MRIAFTEAREISPFEAAQIRLAGRGRVLSEERSCAPEVAGDERLMGERDIGDVFVEQRASFVLLGAAAFGFGSRFRHCGVVLGATRRGGLLEADN